MDTSALTHFLQGTGTIVALVCATIIAFVKAFSVADLVWQRVRERKVKRLVQAVRITRTIQNKVADNEEAIYREALYQELFYLNLGLRLSKLSRETFYKITDMETDWSLHRILSILQQAPLRKNKDGKVTVFYLPSALLAIASVPICIVLLLYALAVSLSDDPWTSMSLLTGMGLRFLYSITSGAAIGFFARVSIMPCVDAMKLHKHLQQLNAPKLEPTVTTH